MAVGQRVLTRADREEIRNAWKSGATVMEIAVRVSCSMPTVYNELHRGRTGDYDPDTMRPIYDPDLAERTYMENIKRRGNRGPRLPAAAEREAVNG